MRSYGSKYYLSWFFVGPGDLSSVELSVGRLPGWGESLGPPIKYVFVSYGTIFVSFPNTIKKELNVEFSLFLSLKVSLIQ